MCPFCDFMRIYRFGGVYALAVCIFFEERGALCIHNSALYEKMNRKITENTNIGIKFNSVLIFAICCDKLLLRHKFHILQKQSINLVKVYSLS